MHGVLTLDTGEAQYEGIPVNLGLGGLFFRANPAPPENTRGTLELQVEGFEQTISAEVRVVRSHGSIAAAVYLVGSMALVKCIEWLGQQETRSENCTTSPAETPAKKKKAVGA